MSGKTLSGSSATRKPKESAFCQQCGAWRGCLGLEPTPELYVKHMVDVFREVRRVLHLSGSVWINIGDSYAGTHTTYDGKQNKWQHGEYPGRREAGQPNHGLKPKDLCGIPWRVAFALQADGWWLRSDIIWSKPNPMPESVTDRPTKSHEYLFLLSKNQRYFYDADAVRETATVGDHPRNNNKEYAGALTPRASMKKSHGLESLGVETGRNRRTVWTVATQPFPGQYCKACKEYYPKGWHGLPKHTDEKGDDHAICKCGKWDRWLSHFATFGRKLVEPCIMAGTSEKGCCPECGSQWERQSEVSYTKHRPSGGKKSRIERGNKVHDGGFGQWGTFGTNLRKQSKTIGWKPTCSCNADPIPCVAADIFGGTGTVALEAHRLGRRWWVAEKSPDYCDMAVKRIKAATQQLRIF
jgi:DNA modification methylase